MKTIYIFSFLCLTFCLQLIHAEVDRVEYFFNIDPGYGNGTAINIDTDNAPLYTEAILSTASLPLGFNNLYIRASKDGWWSHTIKRPVWIIQSDHSGVKEFEYYYTNTSGFKSNTYTNVGLINEIDQYTFDANTSELQYDSTYTLHVWAIDSLENRSYESSIVFTFLNGNVQIKEVHSNPTLLYPNPASNFIRIDFDEQLLQESRIIRIIDVSGKIILNISPFELQNTSIVDISDLKGGIYSLQFIGDNIYSSKFIKQ